MLNGQGFSLPNPRMRVSQYPIHHASKGATMNIKFVLVAAASVAATTLPAQTSLTVGAADVLPTSIPRMVRVRG